ncbi:MAG: NAD(P)H-hydrate dehydratase, partial [Anaerolineae bacterium]|nr:NAD(P)H-hydrate dehydratase [Anaerolineae bacterium]
MKIISVEQMQTLERITNDSGVDYAEMMLRAGTGVADVLETQIDKNSDSILFLIGPGNNGGDGLVAARILHIKGYDVLVYLSRIRDPQQDNEFRQVLENSVRIIIEEKDQAHQALREAVQSSSIIIDALLGTGSVPPLRGVIAEILKDVHIILQQTQKPFIQSVQQPTEITGRRHRIYAVDGPSGLDFDTGQIDELALPANTTVTFAYPKWGHLKAPGAHFSGSLMVVDIGTTQTNNLNALFDLADSEMIRNWLPKRAPDAHKGSFGRAMIVAGSANYTGAAVLSTMGALRAGAGLVTLAIPSNLHTAVASAIPESTFILLPHTMGVINEHAASVVKFECQGYTSLLIGPGLSHTTESHRFINSLFQPITQTRKTGFISAAQTSTGQANTPQFPKMVIDADGLNLLTQIPDWHKYLPKETILTPHPGEMARLTGLSVQDINHDRINTALHWAKIWDQIVVLKGAHTVNAHPDGRAIILPFSNAGLSTAGTGDVLAGAIVSMLAQGLAPFEAAVTGGYIHGLAGELCRQNIGTAGMIA